MKYIQSILVIIIVLFSAQLFAQGKATKGEDYELRMPSSKWVVYSNTDPIDDSRTVIFFLPAEDNTSSAFNRNKFLFVRFKNNAFEVFISWKNYIGRENATVITRYDGNPAEEESWSCSLDGDSTFSADHEGTIKKILQSKKLVVRVQGYREVITTIFNIHGLKEAARASKYKAGWLSE